MARRSTRNPRLTAGGRLDVLCVFHEEKTPSLRLFPSGRFLCHGCGAAGWWRETPELVRYSAVFDFDPRQELLPFGDSMPGVDPRSKGG